MVKRIHLMQRIYKVLITKKSFSNTIWFGPNKNIIGIVVYDHDKVSQIYNELKDLLKTDPLLIGLKKYIKITLNNKPTKVTFKQEETILHKEEMITLNKIKLYFYFDRENYHNIATWLKLYNF